MSLVDTHLSLQGLLNKVYDPTNNALRVSGSGDAFFLPPSAFKLLTGTPAESVVNGVQSWEMDAAVLEAVTASITLPMFWRNINIDIYHGTRSAVASANVRHRVTIKDLASGNLITEAAISDVSANVATPAQNAAARRSGHNSNIAVLEDSLIALVYERTATDAGDTYTADSSFFGLGVRRAA